MGSVAPGSRLGLASDKHYSSLPRWCSGKEPACQCKRLKLNPWVRKIPWSRKWQPTAVLLPWKFRGQRSLAGYSLLLLLLLSRFSRVQLCATS